MSRNRIHLFEIEIELKLKLKSAIQDNKSVFHTSFFFIPHHYIRLKKKNLATFAKMKIELPLYLSFIAEDLAVKKSGISYLWKPWNLHHYELIKRFCMATYPKLANIKASFKSNPVRWGPNLYLFFWQLFEIPLSQCNQREISKQSSLKLKSITSYIL